MPRAQGWRQGDAVNEARTPYTHEYLRAFLAIDDPQTAALMREYLTDEHFGALAAQVFASQWLTANEPAVRDITNQVVSTDRTQPAARLAAQLTNVGNGRWIRRCGA